MQREEKKQGRRMERGDTQHRSQQEEAKKFGEDIEGQETSRRAARAHRRIQRQQKTEERQTNSD